MTTEQEEKTEREIPFISVGLSSKHTHVPYFEAVDAVRCLGRSGFFLDKPFVHLHVHSEYSWDGACKCNELAPMAKELGMDSIALTDHGYLHGALEFYESCTGNGIQPIIGCEFYVKPEKKDDQEEREPSHLILLAENDVGYGSLIRLASFAAVEGLDEIPLIDQEILRSHAKGLIGTSSCLKGEIPALVLKGDIKGAERGALFYRGLLGSENFFLEIHPGDDPVQVEVNRGLAGISQKHGIPLVATNNVHYLRKSDADLHDILVAAATGRRGHVPEGVRKNCLYLRSPEEMWTMLGNELPESLLNTSRIAARCRFHFDTGRFVLPQFPLPENETIDMYLRRLAEEGLKRRLNTPEIPDRYRNRLLHELGAISQAGVSACFCIVADIISAAKEENIQVGPGQGAAAGSLVAWSLGITGIDPLRYGLFFERLLNPKRMMVPNIDVEVAGKSREKLLGCIARKYGSERVARIIFFEGMHSGEAMVDAGRALGLPLEEVFRVIRLLSEMPPFGISTTSDAVEKNPELKSLYESDQLARTLLDTAKRLELISPRQSEHTAGVVITPGPAAEMLPVQITDGKRLMTQYSSPYLEKFGFVKFDFLGLRALSVLEDTLAAISANGKGFLDLGAIPEDDGRTFEMLQRGEIHGVYMMDSFWMADMVKWLKPECFDDLMALVALFRPGPLENGTADRFIRCRHGKESVRYLHPALEDLTRDPRGIVLYHEQMIQGIAILAGYSAAEADELRRAMAGNKAGTLADHRQRFIDGAGRKNIGLEEAGKLFDNLKTAASYGFSKAYSAGCAMMIYRSAWLKAHYPSEFSESWWSIID